MIRFLRAFWRLVRPRSFEYLLREASEYGRLKFEQIGIEHEGRGVIGWQCFLRAHERPEVDGYLERHPQFAWKGEGPTMVLALEAALEYARETGSVTKRIVGDEFAPRLGGKRFD